jgi:hypothetical protein
MESRVTRICLEAGRPQNVQKSFPRRPGAGPAVSDDADGATPTVRAGFASRVNVRRVNIRR